jgi:hypothetical protein
VADTRLHTEEDITVDTTHHPETFRPAASDVESGPATDRPSRAFRIVSWIVALASLAAFIWGLSEIVLMWLSDSTLVSLLAEDGETNPIELDYRSQFFHIGILNWAIVPSLIVLLRTPQRRTAPMLQVWLGSVALLVVMALVGGPEPIDFIIFGVYTLLIALFPARSEVLRRPSFDRWQIGVLAVGVIPWLVRAGVAVGDARDAGDFEVGGTPVHMIEGNVALAIVVMLLAAVIGSTDKSTWKLPAWTAALSSVLLGVHALVFDDQAASVPAPWAIAAVIWGVAYAAAIVHRNRRTTPAPSDG